MQFSIKNSFCSLLLAKAKCTRVLGAFFDRVPSTLTFKFEYLGFPVRVRVLKKWRVLHH